MQMPVRRATLLSALAVLVVTPQAIAAVPLQGTQIDLAAGSNARIQSTADNSYSGAARGVGDVNGDGTADMAFPEQAADSSAGRIVVVLGGENIPSFDSPAVGSRGFVIRGRPGSRLGKVAAAGDVNGDGIADIVAGAFTDNAAGTNAGAAYVIFGTRSPADIDLAALGGAGFVISGDQDDYLGASVDGAGDLNGDGRADVVIGGFNAGTGGGSGAGEAYVVFGRPGTATVEVHAPSFASQGIVVKNGGGAANDQFGAAVRNVGDFDGDGLPDIGVWATSNTLPQRMKSAWVAFGRQTPGTIDVSLGGGVKIDPPAPASPTPDHATREPLPAGDINGDGRADIVIGVPEDGALGRSGAAAAAVVYGRPGPTTINPMALGGGGFRVEGAIAGAWVEPQGVSPDLDGDGRAELLFGAAAADNRGRTDSGTVWLIPAVPPALGSAYDLLFPPPGSRQIDGASANGFLSSAAAVGDVNGDGRPDLTVGGIGIGGNYRGASELLLGFGQPAVQYGQLSGTAGSAIAPLAPSGIARTGTASFSAAGLPAGLTIDASTGTISGTPQAAASGNATVTMTDLSGSVTVSVPLAIGAAPTAGPPKITLSSVSLSARRFATVKRKGSKRTYGARLSWKLNTAATVTVTVERLLAGRRSGRKCVTKRRKGKRCTIVRRSATLTIKAKSGATTVRIPASSRKLRLKPGRYRVRVAVKGGPAAKPLSFTVVR